MSFLPQDYEAPKSNSGYMKIQVGENKIRILSAPILGFEDWKNDKPIRFRMNNKPVQSIDPAKPFKHFWSMIVWNHIEEQIQILNITQASVRKSIEDLCNNPDWGSPYHYDLKIVKTGEGMKTKYAVSPSPHKPIGDYVEQMFHEKKINLEALFDGRDPFDSNWSKYTPGIFERKGDALKEEIKPVAKISPEQVTYLGSVFENCDPLYVDKVKETMKKLFKSDKFEDIPLHSYEKIFTSAIKNRNEYALNNQNELPF